MEILVLYSHSLLAVGVESLLKKENLEVRGMNLEDPEAMDKVRCLGHDDVVVMDTSETASHPFINISEVFSQNPHVVIIALNSQDNKVAIFRKEERTIARLSDLVDILKETLKWPPTRVQRAG